MKLESLVAAAAITSLGAALLGPTASYAQAREQFYPVLVNRTGAFAPSGVPWANGYADYMKLVNAKGGINGVKVVYEECETGYDTARGVECYERMKGKHGGATLIQPMSTGVTFALTEKAPIDKIPLITPGYGRSESQDGLVFGWNFPLAGSYWVGADVLIQHIAKKEGGFDKLKGKKIALVYHDSPYGKEPIPLLQARAKLHGYELQTLPITNPGVEQRSTWLQIRQGRPDYVLLWGWGVMNSVALKEAQAIGYPRDKMYGVWWSATEVDVKDVGADAAGYNGLALQHGAHPNAKVTKDILATLHDKGQGTGRREEVGSVMYMRGVMNAMLGVEGVKRAQERYGKGKWMTAEQTRWGLENMALDEKKLEALGFGDVMRPVLTTCADHMGPTSLRIITWDGSKWNVSSDWYKADESIIKPLVASTAAKYAADNKITPRTSAQCQE